MLTFHAAKRAWERIGVKLSPEECQELGVQIIERRPVKRRAGGCAEYALELRGDIPVRVVFDGCDIITLWLDEWRLLRERR